MNEDLQQFSKLIADHFTETFSDCHSFCLEEFQYFVFEIYVFNPMIMHKLKAHLNCHLLKVS